jgi:dihydrodipicolinate synthase/N-acetylneuraminate lyase
MSRAMEPVVLEGVVPILMTPVLENDQLGWDDLRQQVDFLLAHGTAAYSFGFGSEVLRLTEAERDAALDVVVERTDGRAHVIASVLAGSTAAAVQRAEVAKASGAVAVMLPAPAFGAADEEALFHHYATVGREADIAIVVQDAPSMSGSELPTDLLVRLAREVEQVVTLKIESEPSAPKISHIARQLDGEATVLGGGGGLDFLHELERGADGTMPGPALVDFFQRVLRLHREGERQDARREFERLLPVLVLALRSLDTFLFVEKEILRRRGVFTSARLRLPAAAPEALLVAELDALLQGLDLQVPADLRIAGAELTATDGDLTSEVM